MDSQYKKGVLDLCVLSQLVDGDKYGYDLQRTGDNRGHAVPNPKKNEG